MGWAEPSPIDTLRLSPVWVVMNSVSTDILVHVFWSTQHPCLTYTYLGGELLTRRTCIWSAE